MHTLIPSLLRTAALAALFIQPLTAAVVVPGFHSTLLPANDDGSSGLVSIGFNVNFFGHTYNSLYINNNGNVTFDAALGTYTPFNLSTANRAIIAPFFADVDTRGAGSALTGWGTGTFAGRTAFAVTWPGVGYYSSGTDKLNVFQLILTDRSDVAPGDFDIYFHYDQIQWETGGASGGSGGLGGSSARAGYSNGEPGIYYELPGSAINGALLDGGLHSLVAGSNTGLAGQYHYLVRNGNVTPPPPVVPGVPEGGATAGLLIAALLAWLPFRRCMR
jgi:hypothetical protein